MNILQNALSRRWWLATILVILGALMCVRLGIWQLDRLSQRREFNEHYLESSVSSPITLDSYPTADLTRMEYRLITVTGKYDSSNNIVLRNQYRDNQPGYFLFTPLVFSDGTGILVERGWIPAEGNSIPDNWHKYDLGDSITISGIIRVDQSQPEVDGVQDPAPQSGQTHLDFWNQVNLTRIASQIPYRLAPVFVQPNPNPAPLNPPFPYQPVIDVSEGPHLGYAIQWFIFAGILLIGYPFYFGKQLTHHNSNAAIEE